tara:strand:- start:505 stop:693 length:189 start_codon:yes stop_codon:yes gene_type:complete
MKVAFKKYGLKGVIEGLTISEEMNFSSWEDACDWAGVCTMSPSVPFVILEMTNLETSKKEFF